MARARRLVVTGASTGIGRAIAEGALVRGWSVLGTVRKDADADALEALGIATARLDLADSRSIAAGCATINAWCDDALDAVVHNAGSSWPGPVELLSLGDLRQQFEVNTFGHVDVTQRLLPAVRLAKGRMLYISSDSVTVTPPLLGAYAASKRAIEAIAEALAQEVSDQGVSVVVVAPGPFATDIWGTSTPRGDAYVQGSDPRADRYRDLADNLLRTVSNRKLGDAADLAAVVLDALDQANPPFRIVSPFASRVQGMARNLLGARRFHKILLSELRRRGAKG